MRKQIFQLEKTSNSCYTKAMSRLFKQLLCAISAIASHLDAFVIGNPAQPALLTTSVIHTISEDWSFRVAYLDDYVYNQHVKNEFDFGPSNEKPPLVRFSTDAALITLNLWKRLDLYGIVGSSKLQMDQEIYTRRELAWGFGGKILFYNFRNLRLGCDLKYFQSNQQPLYLIVTGMPLNIVSDWIIKYREYQAAIGASYQAGMVCPYVNVSYIVTKLEPQPFGFLVNVPGMSEPTDASIRSFDGLRRWGMAVGASLIAGATSTLCIESRFFNQNAIDASLEIRF